MDHRTHPLSRQDQDHLVQRSMLAFQWFIAGLGAATMIFVLLITL